MISKLKALSKSTAFLTTLTMATFFLASCSIKTKNLNTAEGTLLEAQRLMKDEFYEEARNQFQRIKTEFPTSPLQLQASIGIADSYYEDEAYPAAATAYEDFVRTYPGRDEAPYALYRLGMSFAKQIPDEFERDSRTTEKARDIFSRLLVDYPQSQFKDDALARVKEAEDRLAKKAHSVAAFYEKMNLYLAAAIRYDEMVNAYPEHPLAEEALARRVVMLRKTDKSEDAATAEEKFKQRFPDSKFKTMMAP